IEGELQADSIEAAERKILAQDITVISIVPAGMKRGSVPSAGAVRSGPLLSFGKPKEGEVADALRDLAVMVKAGVPFVEALDAVIQGVRKASLRGALEQIKDDIVGGSSLSSALRNVSHVFPELIAEMVRVAEEGGRLDVSLESAANYLERTAELKKKILSAMAYPLILVTIALLTVSILIFVVLPKFATVFQTMGVKVPAATRVLLSMGSFVRSQPYEILTGALVLIAGIPLLLRLREVRRALGVFALKIPVVGDLVRKLALARSLECLATLLNSNAAMMVALDHSARVSGNAVLERGFLDVRSAVEQGTSLSEAMAETKVFPATLIQMVSVGERSGRLAYLMATLATRFQQEVDSRLKTLVAILEPLMIVVMGGIVALITLSVIVPIYSVINTLK
ncbi:MAG: type II secretion system F family protein, partial [Fimbriimonadales bacterium]|nr:type II secretion system F family protein [Fimbriimonadales bacterium]